MLPKSNILTNHTLNTSVFLDVEISSTCFPVSQYPSIIPVYNIANRNPGTYDPLIKYYRSDNTAMVGNTFKVDTF